MAVMMKASIGKGGKTEEAKQIRHPRAEEGEREELKKKGRKGK